VHPPRSSSQLSPRRWSPRTFAVDSRIILDVARTPRFLLAPSFSPPCSTQFASPPGAVVLSSLLEPVRLLLLAATSVLHFPPLSSYQFASYFWRPRVCTVFPPPCSYQFASYFWRQRVCSISLLLARTSSPPTSGGQECAPFSLLLARTSSPPTSGGKECACPTSSIGCPWFLQRRSLASQS
jgi:hypothetical protein